MTRAKTLNDLVMPTFTKEQIEYLRLYADLYKQDRLNLDPMKFKGPPEYSELHLKMVELGASYMVLDHLATKAEIRVEEVQESLIDEAKHNQNPEGPAYQPQDPHTKSPF